MCIRDRYNRILGEDDSYAAAYLMRGKAKYELGAYRGTKKDILDYIEENGVTKEVIKLMSKTELNLENYKAAKNYAKTALELDPYDADQYKIAGDVERAIGNDNEACEMWYSASELGDSKSKSLLEKHCGIYMKLKRERRDDRQRPSTSNANRNDREQSEDADTMEESGDLSEEDLSTHDEVEDQGQTNVEAPNMDAIQEIEICLLYTSPSPRDATLSRMPSSA